ncbi:MAG: hypothetical protein HOP22_01410 [Nitrospiraceae bacterium]|jgi:hypothetical protein|nr:hypothetical protein [Nitrospiraceae bacterium]
MGTWDKISGKTVEDKVTEYSEVYGEVLLGLHRDLERQNRFLQEGKKRRSFVALLFARDGDCHPSTWWLSPSPRPARPGPVPFCTLSL